MIRKDKAYSRSYNSIGGVCGQRLFVSMRKRQSLNLADQTLVKEHWTNMRDLAPALCTIR